MQAGRLRNKVTLQRRDTTQDAVGGAVDTYVDVAVVYAAIEPLQGREYYAAQQVQADVTTRIRIRYRDDVTELWRVLFQRNPGDSPAVVDVYDVEAVLHTNEKRRETQLMCVKRGADGSRSA